MSTTPGDPDHTPDESAPDEGATTPPPPPPTEPLGYWEQQAAGGQQQPPPPTPPGPGGPQGGAAGYGYAPQYPVYRLADHPKATTALVLGLVGIVGGLTCYVPLVLGPWAWGIGRRAVKEIDADPQRFGGRSQAMTGYVLGIISTVLLVLGILALVAFLVFAFAFSGTSGQVGGIRV
jgi:hypothetical protein